MGVGGGLGDRVLSAFVSSLELMVVVLAAAIPWVILFLFLSWLSLKFLKWWVRKKREGKFKKQPGDVS